MAGLTALAYGALVLRRQVNAQNREVRFRPTFSLADSAGQLRTTDKFAGKFQLVFFGFAICPDDGPTTLSQVAQGCCHVNWAAVACVKLKKCCSSVEPPHLMIQSDVGLPFQTPVRLLVTLIKRYSFVPKRIITPFRQIAMQCTIGQRRNCASTARQR